MKALGLITFILLVVGGLNWGLIGLFNLNLVATLFGEMSLITRVIYILVGLAALKKLVMCKGSCCSGDHK